MIGIQPPSEWNWAAVRGLVVQRGSWTLLCKPADVPTAAELAGACGLLLQRVGSDRVELRIRESGKGGPIGPRVVVRQGATSPQERR